VSHVLIECITLGLMGSALGVVVALGGVRLIALSFPDGVPSYVDLGIQLPVLGVTLVIALLCAIGFGIVPAFRAGRTRSSAALHTATRVTSTRSRRRGRNLLITAEIALTVILVAFAAVLVQSEVLLRRSLGFRPDGLLTVRVPLPTQVERYRGDAAQRAFYTELQNRLKALPGVESVSASLLPAPLDGDTPGLWNLIIDGVPRGSNPSERTRAAVFSISPGYLATLGIPLVQGRALTSADTATAERAILVNEMFVRRYLPAGDAVGQRIGWDVDDGKPRPLRVVGVIADYRQQRPPGEVLPTVYTNNDFAFPWQTFMLRTHLSDPSTLAPAIRAIVRELDPTLVTYGLQTQERLVQRSFWRERLQGRVVGIFALLALLLAVFGMYGVLSYAVAQRTSEFGVRVALGASPRQLLLLTLGQAARAALIGVTAGVAFAVALSRVLSGLLYSVSPTDPFSLASAALALLTVAILAGVLPARRAARLDPATAIRLS
jgi:predicted permease